MKANVVTTLKGRPRILLTPETPEEANLLEPVVSLNVVTVAYEINNYGDRLTEVSFEIIN